MCKAQALLTGLPLNLGAMSVQRFLIMIPAWQQTLN